MDKIIDSAVLDLFIPFAVIGGAFVVVAVATEVYGRIEAKRKGIKFKSIF